MSLREWAEAVDIAITVCDAGGAILEMNQRAARMFEGRGGKSLIGSNVLDCHPEPARTKLRQLLERPQANTYTTEERAAGSSCTRGRGIATAPSPGLWSSRKLSWSWEIKESEVARNYTVTS